MAVSNTVSRQDVLASINITPLVDVLLVLLVIFMITAPAVTRTIGLDLPQPTPGPVPPPAAIELRIDASGAVHWSGAEQPSSALQGLLEVERQRHADRRQPLLEIDASDDAEYEAVARVLAAARNAGLDHIAFVRR
jgi:biopolymer transport protein ExbD